MCVLEGVSVCVPFIQRRERVSFIERRERGSIETERERN